MNAVTKVIRTPKGEELVLLTKAEYERLRRLEREAEATQDAEDLRIAERVLAEIKSGQQELVPQPVVNRLLAGENPVLVWREYRKLTAEALAKQAGLSRAYVTQIETGARKGSARSLQALARALKVGIEDLLPRQD